MIFIMYILYMWYVFMQADLDYWFKIGVYSEAEIDQLSCNYWVFALVVFNILVWGTAQ